MSQEHISQSYRSESADSAGSTDGRVLAGGHISRSESSGDGGNASAAPRPASPGLTTKTQSQS